MDEDELLTEWLEGEGLPPDDEHARAVFRKSAAFQLHVMSTQLDEAMAPLRARLPKPRVWLRSAVRYKVGNKWRTGPVDIAGPFWTGWGADRWRSREIRRRQRGGGQVTQHLLDARPVRDRLADLAALDAYANRGTPRGAKAVLDAARGAGQEQKGGE